MDNSEIWERNRKIREQVDEMIERYDKEIFEIFHRIARLAIEQCEDNAE